MHIPDFRERFVFSCYVKREIFYINVLLFKKKELAIVNSAFDLISIPLYSLYPDNSHISFRFIYFIYRRKKYIYNLSPSLHYV